MEEKQHLIWWRDYHDILHLEPNSMVGWDFGVCSLGKSEWTSYAESK